MSKEKKSSKMQSKLMVAFIFKTFLLTLLVSRPMYFDHIHPSSFPLTCPRFVFNVPIPQLTVTHML